MSTLSAPIPFAGLVEFDSFDSVPTGVGIRGLHKSPTRLLVRFAVGRGGEGERREEGQGGRARADRQLLGSISAALGTAFLLARVPIQSVEELWAVPW